MQKRVQLRGHSNFDHEKKPGKKEDQLHHSTKDKNGPNHHKKEGKKNKNIESSGRNVHMIRIYGDDFTQVYYMNLMMGKPLRQQSVILDTGSDLTAVPCSSLNLIRLYRGILWTA